MGSNRRMRCWFTFPNLLHFSCLSLFQLCLAVTMMFHFLFFFSFFYYWFAYYFGKLPAMANQENSDGGPYELGQKTQLGNVFQQFLMKLLLGPLLLQQVFCPFPQILSFLGPSNFYSYSFNGFILPCPKINQFLFHFGRLFVKYTGRARTHGGLRSCQVP